MDNIVLPKKYVKKKEREQHLLTVDIAGVYR